MRVWVQKEVKINVKPLRSSYLENLEVKRRTE
jgi:hypothetical protein